ncbi:MAG TPA: hypothetical protein VLQ45_09455 [Thermoanaerobaculia bacterium]|nr:hypothetical protein [Thermoanaerobaculia bacterium]
MLKQHTRQAGLFGDWQQLNASAVGNAADLEHLEGTRIRLESVLTRLQDVLKQQAALAASKQEMSKLVKDLFAEGQRHATVLRKGIAVHYGPRAEKLTEFKLQPYRGRTRKAKPPEPELPEGPKPPEPTVS